MDPARRVLGFAVIVNFLSTPFQAGSFWQTSLQKR